MFSIPTRYIVSSATLITLVITVYAEDQRCKCICPPLFSIEEVNTTLVINGTDYSHKAVYTNSQLTPETCLCDIVIPSRLPPSITSKIIDLGKFCLRCQCVFEQRNSTVQKVIIIFVIVIFGLMLVYGIFLMCLDPLLNKKRPQLSTQLDESDTMPIVVHPTTSGNRVVRQTVDRFRRGQQRWKGQLNEQRKNIYTRHKMLA